MANVVQRVSLEGVETVIRQLENIGRIGQQTFGAVSNSASKADFARLEQGLRTLGEQSRRAGDSLLSLGNKFTFLLGLQIADGISGVARSITELGKASAEAVDDIADLATQAGTTAERMQAVLSVFRQTGGGIEAVGERMRRFTVQVQQAWEQIKISAQQSGKVYEQNQLNIQESTLSLEQANLNLAKSYKALSAAAGDPIKTEQALLDLRKGQLAVSKAELAVTEAREKAQEDERNSITNLRAAVVALASGTGDLSKVNVTAENVFKGIVAAAGPSIDALKELSTNFGTLSATSAPGAQQTLYLLADVFKNLKDETLKTAIAVQAFGRGVDIDFVKALSKGSEAFKARQKELADLGLAIEEVDTKTADAFKDAYYNLVDLLTLTKEKLGISLTPLYTALAEGFTGLLKRNIGSLKETFAGIKDALTPFVQGLANVMKGVSFDDFKKEAADAFSPEQYINIKLWQDRFRVLAEGVSIVIAAFRGLRTAAVAILDEIAALINTVFGTQISGEGLGIALLIARFSGLIVIIRGVTTAVTALAAVITRLGTLSLANPWVLLAVAVAAVVILIIRNWDTIVAKTRAMGAELSAVWVGFVDLVKRVVSAIAGLWDGLTQSIKDAWNGLATWFQGLLTTLASYWTAFTTAVSNLAGLLVGFVKGVWADIATSFNNLVQTLRGYWADFVQWVQQTAVSIESRIKAIVSALAGAQKAGGAQAAGGAPGMVGGGMVRGGGTGTSDSVLARLSNGEFVVRAAAVRHVGANFLHAINRAPGYAMGGLVEAMREGLSSIATPFAQGGSVGSSGQLRPFTLVMPGGGSYGGLFAQEGAVTNLRRASISAQIASAGRRPGWVR